MEKVTKRSELLIDTLLELMAGAQEPHDKRKNGEQNPTAEAANQIRVRSVCCNINQDTTTSLTWTQYRFDPLPTKCPQCKGKVIIDPMMVKDVLCHLEKV